MQRLSERDEQLGLIARLEGAIAASRAQARELLAQATALQETADELLSTLSACSRGEN